MMKLPSVCLIVFYFERVYGAADGYVDLDGVVVPTGECVFDSDGSGYYFSCNATTMMQTYFAGDYSCSGSGVTDQVTAFDYECTPVGFVSLDLDISACGNTIAGSAFATGICHNNSIENTNVIYSCNSTSFTVTTYDDSNCSTMTDSTAYSSCYYIGTLSSLNAYVEPDTCTLVDNTTISPTTTAGLTTTNSGGLGNYTTSSIGDVDLEDYYGGYFNYSVLGLDIPLPTDTCVPIDLSSSFVTTYGIVTCNNNGSKATLSTYSSSSCSGTADETIVVDKQSGAFDCDSTVRYTSLGLAFTSSCSSSLFEFYIATGRCFLFGGSDYTAMTCDEDSGDVTLYNYLDENCTQLVGRTILDGDDCVEIDIDDLTLYYGAGQCVFPTPSNETTTTMVATTGLITTYSGDGYTTTITTTSSADVDLEDYYGGYFNYSVPGIGIDTPLPIDVCIPVELDTSDLSATYGIATCNNDSTQATLSTYSSSDCSGSVIETIVVDEGSGSFDCDPVVKYTSLGISLFSTCSSFFDLYVATGRCFVFGSNYTAITCDEDSGDMMLYAYLDENCTQFIGVTELESDDCVQFEAGGFTLYYGPGVCVTGNITMTATTTETMTTVTTTASESTTESTSESSEPPDTDEAVGVAVKIAFTLVTIMVFNL